MLLEEGFQVTSVDASDKMLKYALKERWERRKEEPFDRWGAGPGGVRGARGGGQQEGRRERGAEGPRGGSPSSPSPRAAVIEEANWLTLEQDLEKPGDGFVAVICLGNSFTHLPDFKGEARRWGCGWRARGVPSRCLKGG